MKSAYVPIARTVFGCACLFVSSCAHVTFHPARTGSDLPDTTQETGIKYYSSKPYLMVSYTGNKDAPVKIDLVYLPDLDHPVYAMYHSGLGSHQFTVNFSASGTLTSYGQTADSKIPETLAAIGGMVSSLATGLKTAGIVQQAAAEDPAISAVKEAIGRLQIITVEMDQQSALVKTVSAQAFQAQTTLLAVLDGMRSGNFDQKEALERVLNDLKALHVDDAQGNPDAVTINNAIKGAQTAVQKAIDALARRSGPTAPPKPDFLLFEIRSVGGVTTLIPVPIQGQ